MTTDAEKARAHLLQFRQRTYKVNPDGRMDEADHGIAGNLSRAIEQLSTGLYEKEIHFVFELIQNAEDNTYGERRPGLRFRLLDDDPTSTPGADGCLCVFNNETGFEPRHVESICQIGKSTKSKVSGYIGEKGIGFKSVFIVSGAPHVFSNGYRFHFLEEDPSLPLRFVVPYWVEAVPEVVAREGMTTALLLPLKPSKREQVARELRGIEPEVLLFLQKLDSLSFSLGNGEGARVLERDLAEAPIARLTVQEPCEEAMARRYWLESVRVTPPADLKEEKRRDVTECPITVAFPLDDDSPEGGVFAFLPTEVRSGLPFHLNADFLLAANREGIQLDRRWNRWLRDALVGPAVAGLRAMRGEDDFRTFWHRFVPLQSALQDARAFFEPFCKGVCETIGKEACVLTVDGHLELPANARLVTRDQRALLEGTPRPEPLESVHLVDAGLQKYARQLRALGVRDLSDAEFRACLCDRDWLRTRPPQWFAELYRFIKDGGSAFSKRLESRPWLLLSNAQVVSRKETPVLVPGPGSHMDALEARLASGGLPRVTLLHPEVFGALIPDPTLREWVAENFDLHPFSMSRYLDGQLIPWLESRVSEAESSSERDDAAAAWPQADNAGSPIARPDTATVVLAATALVAEFWDELDQHARESVSSLPVVLNDKSAVTREEIEDRWLVVPEPFDPDGGWQLIFQTAGDREHLAVLSEDYLSVRLSQGLRRDELLDSLGATQLPGFARRKYDASVDFSTDPDADYIHECLSGVGPCSRLPCFETVVPPTVLSGPDALRRDAVRRTLVKILEGQLQDESVDLRYGTLNWFYYHEQYRFPKSALRHRLLDTRWVKTTNQWKRPGEVFRESEHLRSILGDRLPYLVENFSDELCEFLDIKTEATTESVLDYLRELSRNETPPSRTLVQKLYEFLSHYGEGYEEAFDEERLIWAPGNARQWWKASEVLWRDASSAMPDLYGYLEPVYGQHKGLQEFFIENLGIREVAQAEELARAWSELPQREDLGHEQIENALEVILRGLLAELEGDGKFGDWWEELCDKLQIWSRSRRFVRTDECFFDDDVRLRNFFGDDLEFIWLPERTSQADLMPLYQPLGVLGLSEAVDVELEGAENAVPREAPEIITELTKRLLAYLVWAEGGEFFRTLIEKGTLPRLLGGHERLAERLTIRYVSPAWNAEDREVPEASFWEQDAGALLLSQSVDSEEQLDSVAETLARVLWGRTYKRRLDRVLAVLGVASLKRFRSIRDRRGWHMPLDEQKRVDDWIAAASGKSNLAAAQADGSGDPETATGATDARSTAEPEGVPGDSSGNPVGGGTGSGSVRSSEERAGSRPGAGPSGGSTGERGGSHHWPYGGVRRPPPGGRMRSGLGGGLWPGASAAHSGGRGSRSGSVTRSLNASRQGRLVTYVEGGSASEEGAGGVSEADRARGERAEEWVVAWETAEGREAYRMGAGNPGYDIESIDASTGTVRFIEVKSTEGHWGERGVGLSKRQYEDAREKADAFWLYVVENADSPHPKLHRLQNPANLVTQYQFDGGWAQVATRAERSEDSEQRPRTTPELVEELQSYTDDSLCQALIARCAEEDLPFPEVGYEVVDADGRVLGEVELAWENHALAIAVPGTPAAVVAALEAADWAILQPDSFEAAWVELPAHLEAERA